MYLEEKCASNKEVTKDDSQTVKHVEAVSNLAAEAAAAIDANSRDCYSNSISGTNSSSGSGCSSGSNLRLVCYLSS